MKTNEVYADICIKNDEGIFMVSRKIPLDSPVFGLVFEQFRQFYRMVKLLYPKGNYRLIIE